MPTAHFRFYGELNDFLPRSRRDSEFAHAFDGRVSIKDMVESLGVPHTEIEAIVVNHAAVDFSAIVSDADAIGVYPPLVDPGLPLVPLRPPLPPEHRFVLDAHLGQLATYLRMLGFDTLYRNDFADAELAQIADDERRILLSRDLGVLKRSRVTYGRFVRATDPQRQVVEVLHHFRLNASVAPLRRCIRCNGMLQAVGKDAIIDRLAPKTREYYDEFSVCSVCGRIYWKGSHYQHMRQFIDSVLSRPGLSP